jgi:hypothetical protein
LRPILPDRAPIGLAIMHQAIYPHFISLDSSNGEHPFPIAIAWSQADGQVKSTLIMPDDAWQPWDRNRSEHDTEFLCAHGASCVEVLQELLDDLDSALVYAFDPNAELPLLERLFEACGRESELELVPFQTRFSAIDGEQIWRQLDAVTEDLGQGLDDCESRVRCLVILADRLDELIY